MTFAHPWLLLGAAAALIPLLVHLFDRRRPRPVPFAAISFVLRSQRRTASRLKLRRLLLYILRTLILLALPVALARPQWRAPAAMARSQRGPAATAIILDASLSMRFADGESLFERGRSLARDALKDLSAEEPATVVICGPGAAPAPPIGFDRARLRSALDDAKPTYGMADLNQCMELAARALDESPMAAKRIVLVSDFTAPALHIESPPPTVASAKGERVRPDFVLRDAARGRAILPNHAVMDLKVEPAIQVGPRAYQFTFAVHNFSNEPLKDLVALLKVGDRTVAKGFVDVPPGGTAQKTLAHSFDVGGSFSGEVALTPDFLAEDDRHSFVVHVPKELRALVINGAPNSVRYRDHAFFVEAALSAGGSPVRETVRDAESAFHEPFDGYELIFLLDVRAPPPEVAARLVEFVQKGGGLFVSMGDEVDAEAYNQRLGALLPRPLRLVKTSALPGDPDAEAKAAKLGQINFDHALFSPFVGRAREGLLSARFYRYMLLEPEA
ncbi:MAG TPA: BatA domain-containing protein, partial [Myxococcaceae bacterium]|nr:BatA domain-containing protein [Myxococcaceae bacterium]